MTVQEEGAVLPKRKPTRLKGYDYSTPGAYFITICVKDRKQMLSVIPVGDGVLDVPQNKLTKCGLIAEKHLNRMNDFYKSISIDTYVIMPNHIHLLLSVKYIDEHNLNGTSGTPSPTISEFVSTFKRFCNRDYGKNIWQRSFHDHIIRNEKSYLKIWEYIDTNVACWRNDCFYSEEQNLSVGDGLPDVPFPQS